MCFVPTQLSKTLLFLEYGLCAPWARSIKVLYVPHSSSVAQAFVLLSYYWNGTKKRPCLSLCSEILQQVEPWLLSTSCQKQGCTVHIVPLDILNLFSSVSMTFAPLVGIKALLLSCSLFQHKPHTKCSYENFENVDDVCICVPGSPEVAT